MDRRWLSTIFWTLLFATGVWIAGRSTPSTQPRPLFGFASTVQQVMEQPQFGTTVTGGEQTSAAVPAATEAPIAREEEATAEEVATILQEDRICDLIGAVDDIRLVVRSLVLVARNPLLNSLYGPGGPLGSAPDYGSQDEVSLFYSALLYGGMIEHGGTLPSKQPSDSNYAEQIFRDLERRDPGNGAYYYFHAGLARRMGRPLNEQHELILKMVDTLKFNTYRPLILGELQKYSRQNATTWVMAIEGMGYVAPIVYPDANLINYLVSRDPVSVQAKVVQFGLMLMEQPNALEDEKRIGSEIVTASWKRVYPREPLPNLHKKIEQDRKRSPQAKVEKARVRAFGSLTARTCDRGPLDRVFARHRDFEYRDK